ncbi:hypothetical protein HHJ77_11830 [Mobiluncus mulieris]|uniref:Uncharacterized protein n=3 Tax=Mobiluncus mulieris TaxID=2052 RepID=A0A7Y0UVL1_9ACTO|nr:hypothetical protein [Mobiluncus mulieris]
MPILSQPFNETKRLAYLSRDARVGGFMRCQPGCLALFVMVVLPGSGSAGVDSGDAAPANSPNRDV